MNLGMGLLGRARRLVRNALVDLRYGGFLGGKAYPSPFSHLGATDSNNSDYSVLDQVFGGPRPAVPIAPDDVLVDVGCGKGRVINWWLNAGHKNRIFGLELDPKIAEATAARLRRQRNVTILSGDAIANLPADATLFYLFNPFDAAVMARFKERVRAHCARLDRVRVVYFAPTQLDVFRGDPGWTIDERQVDLSRQADTRERHRRYALLRPRG